MRTIFDIEENMKPLDDVINNKFIPSLFGCEITSNQRDIIAMPIKEGGLGIRKIGENSGPSFHASCRITTPLVNKILQQSNDLPTKDEVMAAKATTIVAMKEVEASEINDLKSRQDPDLKRTLEQHSEPGSSSWLGALPLRDHGFNLNKGEFRDALSLRYNNKPKNLPAKCPCGETFDVTHALD